MFELLVDDVIRIIWFFVFPLLGHSQEETFQLFTLRSLSRSIKYQIDNAILLKLQYVDHLISDDFTNRSLSLFRHLKELVIRKKSDITDKGLRQLQSLENFRLDGYYCGTVPKVNIRSLKPLINLRKLSLSYITVNLKSLSHLIHLEQLEVDGEPRAIRDEALLTVPWLKKLKLVRNEFITGSSFLSLTRLETLYIYRCSNITDAHLVSLAPTLKELYIGETKTSSTILNSLSNLQSLHLYGDESRMIIEPAFQTLKNLRKLGLKDNYHIELLKCPILTQITELDLYANRYGRSNYINSEIFNNLQILRFSHMVITWDNSALFPHLKEIYVGKFARFNCKNCQEDITIYNDIPTNWLKRHDIENIY